jgi:dihydrofolate reductase
VPKLLNIIVACSENRVIGRDRRVPWRIPEDSQFFHERTAGRICILGRIGFETWPRATQDGRRPIVLTRQPLAVQRPPGENAPASPAPLTAPSLPAALEIAGHLPGGIFVCGGQRIYEETLALDRPMRLYLTLVHAVIAGDTFFPEWRHLPWREVSRRESADEHYRYTFFTFERLPLRA